MTAIDDPKAQALIETWKLTDEEAETRRRRLLTEVIVEATRPYKVDAGDRRAAASVAVPIVD